VRGSTGFPEQHTSSTATLRSNRRRCGPTGALLGQEHVPTCRAAAGGSLGLQTLLPPVPCLWPSLVWFFSEYLSTSLSCDGISSWDTG